MRTAIITAAAVLLGASAVFAQDTPAKLFEAGQYDQAIQAIGEQISSADTYLAAQIYLKLNRPDDAKTELSRLMNDGDDVWKLVAESERARIDNNAGVALEVVQRAASMDPDRFHVQYQLGLVKAEQNDWAGAADAFDRASQIDPTFAYAHYYAGLAYSKVRRVDRTGAHFETFLRLAPKAPERPAVESIMRTLRGR
ncbi:MAG: tetratricopeptide repeat protein [Vicinamibacterales bacterium]|nr:tetratricopeptide repeat protein [Vicinamibacterales bacterium]